jgi:ubiquinone/menaquinone biosynthesis C-methylase UbiE
MKIDLDANDPAQTAVDGNRQFADHPHRTNVHLALFLRRGAFGEPITRRANCREMSPNESETHSDVWAEWLLRRRHGDDPDFARAIQGRVEHFADRVLDGACLSPGLRVVDVGAGDGLIAFRAIARIGPSLKVLLTDLSISLLRHVERLAIERGVRNQCEFLNAPAEKLAGIADASVDAVMTRSVLAYVADKPAALREFHRVLLPGGRLSIAEPIFQDDALMTMKLRQRIDGPPLGAQQQFLQLLHRVKAAQFPDTPEAMAQSPIANYSERDLFRMAGAAGFTEIHLALQMTSIPRISRSWEVFLESSPHPLAPSVKQTLATQFSPDERRLFEQVFRPAIEDEQATGVERMVYLTATKPEKSERRVAPVEG